ncbi:hypothetical protein Kpol_2001p9 [Vanderwaltozyma polyspora DSM 70294]|uniref:Uncharacterized protein n=1 Tax=Vanderwaltozyma polyspora (strain ATCC 22028 / DSM 70294 / BCRC 21397 / CBS 2163 / NBRC 10782 / NRRL Y-8283 / UCD 57-17) TaxID=436907 RepID=A7TGP5_VANPO|nr:uncharacterized protein Kpol_2001p9 [Vanderwaltozyma polyspora DSM 70294]EDO18508.1 hypothetical protein Kpol_2001p9 [Vanderwaltozyma polyspora DSM 70294]
MKSYFFHLLLICASLSYKWITMRKDFDLMLSEKSRNVVSSYDSIRRRSVTQKLKLSTNTYDDGALEDAKNFRNDPTTPVKQNATLLMLVRNWEVQGALQSMRSLEDRFNKEYNYDWTFLNDVPFDKVFIEATTAMASGKTNYAVIPKEDWDCPEWIDQKRFNQSLQLMQEENIVYGNSRSYRNMCKFNSGYFFRQKVLDNYDYYFRVEPNVEYFCDFPYDPFKIMKEKNKKYGFVIAIYEYEDTIPTLWESVEEFIDIKGDELGLDLDNSAYDFITDFEIYGSNKFLIDSNTNYNLCHFWSNFEVGDLNFYRSNRYIEFFEFLNEKGGFYYERWGDAPIHTLAASILLHRDEIIHFDEIGYEHAPFRTCPRSYFMRLSQRCQCDYSGENNVDIEFNSCLSRWWKNGSGKKFVKEL